MHGMDWNVEQAVRDRSWVSDRTAYRLCVMIMLMSTEHLGRMLSAWCAANQHSRNECVLINVDELVVGRWVVLAAAYSYS